MGVGFGTMAGVGGAVGGMVGGMMNDAMSSATNPPLTNASQPAATDSMTNFKERLEKLMLMKEMGALSDDEFNEQKKKLMESI